MRLPGVLCGRVPGAVFVLLRVLGRRLWRMRPVLRMLRRRRLSRRMRLFRMLRLAVRLGRWLSTMLLWLSVRLWLRMRLLRMRLLMLSLRRSFGMFFLRLLLGVSRNSDSQRQTQRDNGADSGYFQTFLLGGPFGSPLVQAQASLDPELSYPAW